MLSERGPRALALISVALLLVSCAPEVDASGPSGSPTPSSSATATPTASAEPTPSPSTSTPPPDTRAEVDVMLVTLDVIDDEVEATGMLPSIVEEGGTCTLILSREDDEATATAQGAAGPVSTFCGLMTVSTDDLAAGDWKAVIEYSSETYRGTSPAETVKIP